MQTKAALMVLVLLSGTIAGCMSDPDGGGNDGIDSDALDDLFDEYFQDFVNNTSITVINHYHNNTTVVNNNYHDISNYNNTTTVEGGDAVNNYEDNYYSNANYSFGGGNGSTSNHVVYYIDHEFTLAEIWGHNLYQEEVDYVNNSFLVENYSYYDYLQNNWTTENFTIQCSIYYIVGSGSNSSHGNNIVTYWEDNDWYDQAWDDMGYNTTMRDLFQQVAWNNDLRLACDEDYNPNDGSFSGYYSEVFYSFVLPEGMSLQCPQGLSAHPILWYKSGSMGNWSYWSTATVRIDGMNSFSCGWGLGGPADMVVEVYYPQLYYNYEYRVTWNYMLVPVVSSA